MDHGMTMPDIDAIIVSIPRVAPLTCVRLCEEGPLRQKFNQTSATGRDASSADSNPAGSLGKMLLNRRLEEIEESYRKLILIMLT